MADCHVKKRTWANSDLLQDDASIALSHVYTAYGKNYKTLVTGGDWFDSTRPSSVDLNVSYAFREHFTNVYAIAGNHDNTNPLFLLLPHDGKDLSLGQHVWDDGMDLTGFGWCSKKGELEKFLDSYSKSVKPNQHVFLVLHAGLKELLSFDSSYQLELGWLKERFKEWNITILIGHVHTRKTFQIGEHAFVHSPGSLYPCSSDKMGDKHYVSIIDKYTGHITDACCDVRHYETVKYESDEQLKEVFDAMPCLYLPPFVRVELGDRPVPSVDPGYCLVQYVKDSGEVVETGTQTSADDDYTIEDAVREELECDNDIADMAVKLVESDDPVGEIGSWLDVWGVDRLNVKKEK